MRKLLTLAGISILVSLGAVAAVAGSANAATGSGVITESTVSFEEPTINSTPVHQFDEGDIVETTCWTNGYSMGGSHTWLKVHKGGIDAYVHRGSINPPAGLEHC